MWISNWLGREITWPPSPLVNISRDERARRVEKIGMAPTQLLITATSAFVSRQDIILGKQNELVNISRDERARRVENIGMAPTQHLITATSAFVSRRDIILGKQN